MRRSQGDVHLNILNDIIRQEGLQSRAEKNVYFDKSGKLIDADKYNQLPAEQRGYVGKAYANTTQLKIASDQDAPRSTNSDLELGNDMEGKGLRLNFRSQAQLKAHRYDENVLSDINKKMSSAFSDDGIQFQNLFDGVKEGDYVNQALTNMFYRRMDDRAGKDELRLFDTNISDEINNDVLNKLQDKGIDSEFISATIENAKSQGVKRLTTGAVEGRYQAAMYGVARNFNNGLYSVFDMEKLGFSKTNINELYTAVGQDLSNQNIAHSLFGQNNLLDLRIDALGDKQIYKDEHERFIALPWTDVKYFSGNETANTYQKNVSSLKRYVGNAEQNIRDEGIETFQANVAKKVSDIKDSISDLLISKKGILADNAVAVLPDSGVFKASGMHLYGDEGGFWSKLNFKGFGLSESLNLAAQAKKGSAGLNYDYMIAGAHLQNKYYGDDYFATLGLDDLTPDLKENVFKNLRTSGTLAVDTRFPQGYAASTGNSVLYFNDSLNDNSVITGDYSFLKKRGDYDSDEAHFSILRSSAEITHNGKTVTADIDYATYQALQDINGVSVKLSDDTKDLFKGVSQNIFYNAARINPVYVEQIQNSGINSLDVKSPYDYQYMYERSVEGAGYKGKHTLSTGQFYNLTPEQGTVRMAQYVQTAAKVRDSIGANVYDKMDFDSQKTAYMNYIDLNLQKGTQEYNEAYDALAYKNRHYQHQQDTVSTVRRAHAGEINNQAFKYFRVAQMSGFKGNDLLAMAHVHSAINEAFLSPKNETGLGDLELVNKVTDAFNKGYLAMRTPDIPKSQIKSVQSDIEDVVKNILTSRASKEIAEIPGIQKMHDGKVTESEIERIAKLFSSVVEKGHAKKIDFNALNIGVKSSMVRDMVGAYIQAGANTDLIFRGMENAAQDLQTFAKKKGIDTPNMAELFKRSSGIKFSSHTKNEQEQKRKQERDVALQNARKQAWERISDKGGLSEAVSRATTPTLRETGDYIANTLSHVHVSNGNLGLGIAGIAGALALSGYANSTTSSSMPTPAETQAAGVAEYEQMYSPQPPRPPILSDGNLNVMRGTNNQSYVININANSPRGRNAAENAINYATRSAVPQNSSINITSNVSYNDRINSSYINNVFENMIA